MSICINNEKYLIKFLEWDTCMFEEKSAKVVLKDEISQKDLNDIESYIKKEKYIFVTIENKDNNENNNLLIAKLNNIFLADVNIQLKKEKFEVLDNNTNENIKIENNCKTNNQILEISKRAFTHSRFIKDDNLNDNKYNVYNEWAKNSFEKEDKYFCYLSIDNQTLGYILFSIDKEELVIELIAVDKQKKSTGIGSELLREVQKFAINNNIKNIKVGTQLNNIQAQNFYIKNGFRHCQNNSVYHWWIKNR